jgi:hypothetical protein
MNNPIYAYIVNANADVNCFHSVIMEAIANGGKFDEDYDDIFVLTKNPEGSAAEYALTFA